jgi:TetR/AcrR family transcriptional regulator, transcriptional repressor of bet genes
MPRQVDHAARRREILEAMFRVAERGGLAAATYRTIAAEAGVPAPRVQYYFATKGAMFAAAMRELGERVVGRGLALITALGPEPAPAAVLRAAVEGSHPVDDATRQNIVLFYQFLVAALADDSFAESGVVGAQDIILESFASLVRAGQERGEVAPDRDPVHEARLVLFANTGLVLAGLVGILTLDEAKATIDYFLDGLFTARA